MIEESLDAIRVLFRGIVADEVMAVEAAHIADEAERTGRHAEAKALHAISRNHRIRIVEARAHMALLEAESGSLPG